MPVAPLVGVELHPLQQHGRCDGSASFIGAVQHVSSSLGRLNLYQICLCALKQVIPGQCFTQFVPAAVQDCVTDYAGICEVPKSAFLCSPSPPPVPPSLNASACRSHVVHAHGTRACPYDAYPGRDRMKLTAVPHATLAKVCMAGSSAPLIHPACIQQMLNHPSTFFLLHVAIMHRPFKEPRTLPMPTLTSTADPALAPHPQACLPTTTSPTAPPPPAPATS